MQQQAGLLPGHDARGLGDGASVAGALGGDWWHARDAALSVQLPGPTEGGDAHDDLHT